MYATDCGWGKCVCLSHTHTHTHTHKLPSYDCELIDKREFQFKCECVGSTCNLESVNALIRKVPTEHTDLLRRLCGSFGILGSEVRSQQRRAQPIRCRQCTTPGQQYHGTLLSCPNYLPIWVLLYPALDLALLAALRTSPTGCSSARSEVKQRHLACRSINKRDPTREKRLVDEGVMRQSALQKKCPHHLLYPPPLI